MGLVKCPDCKKMVSERVEVCPFCGCPKEFFEKEEIEKTEETKASQENDVQKENPKDISADSYQALEGLPLEDLRKMAEGGNRDAQFELGYAYYVGNNVKEDKEEALKWMKKAAEQGHIWAQYNLGVSYTKGIGTAENKEKAAEWFTKAAEQGVAESQFMLGEAYYNGEGVAINEGEAAKWYRRAAEQGHPIAQSLLAACYCDGVGVRQNLEEAVRWFTKSAEQGHAPAQYWLGMAYYHGEVTEKDEIKSIKWMEKAAEQGFEKAKAFMAEYNKEQEERVAEFEELMSSLSDSNMTEEQWEALDRDRDIELHLAGHTCTISGKFKHYIQLRKAFEKYAYGLRKLLGEEYDNTATLGKVIEGSPRAVESVMNDVIDVTMKMFYRYGISMTPQTFLDKYYYRPEYGMDYNCMISELVEKYAEVMDEKAALEEYRAMQRASRSRWEGGGFGLSGAVKGAIMAGVLNAGTDFIRSFGDASRRKADNAYIQQKLKDLKDSATSYALVVAGGYAVIIGVFRAVYHEAVEQGIAEGPGYPIDSYTAAVNQCEATRRYEEKEEKRLDGYLKALVIDPYYEGTYGLLYEIVKGTEAESELLDIMDYFGITTLLGGYESTLYRKIADFFAESEILRDFDYEHYTLEQYQKAVSERERLWEECGKNLPRQEWHYRRLLHYISEGKRILKNEISDYEDEQEAKLPLDEYIPKVFEKKYSWENASCDGYLWVPGTNLYCAYTKNIDFYNFQKYLKPGYSYLLIYENSMVHNGKRGFGIFEEGIVFFDTRKTIYFKDIIGCEYNEDNVSVIFKTREGNYEFPYNFEHQSLHKVIDSDGLYGSGNTLTVKLEKVIKHYQNLHPCSQEDGSPVDSSQKDDSRADSSEENRKQDRGAKAQGAAAVKPAETINFCRNCGRKLEKEWLICPNCGTKINRPAHS